jgi:type I restriction enzyme S subunit
MTKHILLKYDLYKDSGVKWLGKVPADWDIVRNKEIFTERNSLSKDGSETLLTVSHITGVTPRSEKNVYMFLAETNEGYKICHEGDLVINTMWAWMGALGTSNFLGICSPSYNVYKPKKNIPYNNRYFDYLYRIPNSVMEMTRYSKGIVASRLRLYPREFFQIQTALPDVETQKAIADYLDTKTAQIDRKIYLLEQKAEKYADLKKSLINETVTRGLNKSVPMKDSGVEWIGQIPAHWEVKRISDIAVQQKHKNVGLLEKNLLSLSYGKLKRKDIETSFGLLPESFETYQIVNPGNVILRLTDLQNDWTSLRVGLARERGIITSAYLCLRFSKHIHPVFSYYVLHVYDLSKVFYWLGSGLRSSMKFEDIKVLPFILPSLEEQKAIAEYLEIKTAHIEKIIETIKLEVEKLKELRKTLVNDVVTGKIKVYEA